MMYFRRDILYFLVFFICVESVEYWMNYGAYDPPAGDTIGTGIVSLVLFSIIYPLLFWDDRKSGVATWIIRSLFFLYISGVSAFSLLLCMLTIWSVSCILVVLVTTGIDGVLNIMTTVTSSTVELSLVLAVITGLFITPIVAWHAHNKGKESAVLDVRNNGIVFENGSIFLECLVAILVGSCFSILSLSISLTLYDKAGSDGTVLYYTYPLFTLLWLRSLRIVDAIENKKIQ